MKRIVSIIVLLAVMVTSSGCGSSDKKASYDMDYIQRAGKAIVAVNNTDYPKLNMKLYMDDPGYDDTYQYDEVLSRQAEILKEFSKRYDVKLEFYYGSKEEIQKEMKNGSVDIVMGRIVESVGNWYSFSQSLAFYSEPLYYITSRSNTYNVAEDLKTASVVVVEGSRAESYFSLNYGDEIKTLSYSDAAHGFKQVQENWADVLVCDKYLAKQLLEKNSGNYKIQNLDSNGEDTTASFVFLGSQDTASVMDALNEIMIEKYYTKSEQEGSDDGTEEQSAEQ